MDDRFFLMNRTNINSSMIPILDTDIRLILVKDDTRKKKKHISVIVFPNIGYSLLELEEGIDKVK